GRPGGDGTHTRRSYSGTRSARDRRGGRPAVGPAGAVLAGLPHVSAARRTGHPPLSLGALRIVRLREGVQVPKGDHSGGSGAAPAALCLSRSRRSPPWTPASWLSRTWSAPPSAHTPEVVPSQRRAAPNPCLVPDSCRCHATSVFERSPSCAAPAP